MSKIVLFQMEQCHFCIKVRRWLGALGLDYEIRNVSTLGSERPEVLALAGIEKAEVPVLVDGETVIQDSGAIIEHLRERYGDGRFGMPSYGLTRPLEGMAFGDAVAAAKAALATEGFGVLSEIDVKATLAKKLGVEFRNYVILGACNPGFAHEALTAELPIGLLLPCNVVVTEETDGQVVVSAISPLRMLSVVGRSDVVEIAKEVGHKLRAALAKI